MADKNIAPQTGKPSALFHRVREIIEAARAGLERTVNTAQVVAYWRIGREIVEEEQQGKRRAGYPHLLSTKPIRYTVCSEFKTPPSGELQPIRRTPSGESWSPGRLHPNLAWSSYRALLKVDDFSKRAFYEIEAVKNNWSVRELRRQIDSLLYERLAKSKDKTGVMKLAVEGQEIRRPGDVFKDPMVIEFVGLPEPAKLAETDLERLLLDNLPKFLLELGKGLAFMSRQERITLDGDHFYVDLVFYHAILKCYYLIDIKVGKMTHEDLGQMLFYKNYFDRERRGEGDGRTIGVILCTDKNDAVVRYTLGEEESRLFVSRYKLHLPTEAELTAELKRELLSFRRDAR